ncbi:U32 family peptidase C-terminal domain-containing protein [Patescibacteria group bacterium]|nr:U32 family peptidase C-terminal domain-containing protein [Patescibacteria group bacterium]MBU4600825.1 U32 family peptidase C-terminal domain-containing protein [Patescibacteria group bacterium]MCG2698054.1 U32 family peptidase C-terminal domain-containing protein [Candidatus Parcubacteria bacterium]
MNKKFKNLELIAPAGNLEKMKTAFAFGADAVYAGIPDFSLRVRINDFTIAKLGQAVKYARAKNKKIYITINIFAHNKHIKKLPAFVKKLKELKPDGLIISDPGVLQVVKKIWPQANIHLSTQANCTNSQAAKFWHEQGIKRVILGRETTLNEIKEIHRQVPKLELEYFVHGAMCMAYSGRCFLSKYFADRSANLGDCAQPCRWNYLTPSPSPCEGEGNYGLDIKARDRNETLEIVEEKHGSYILNSKDLCLIKRLAELEKAGVKHFKIEGRAKSVYYIANVAGIYAKAINNLTPAPASSAGQALSLLRRGGGAKQRGRGELDFLYKELEEKLFHRGYTEGFLFGNGKLAQNLDDSHEKCGWEFCGQITKTQKHENTKTRKHSASPQNTKTQKHENTKTRKYDIYIKVHNSLKVGDEVEIVMPFYDIIKMRVESMKDSKTGEELNQAHGGQGKAVVIESDVEAPEFSVVRRNVKK